MVAPLSYGIMFGSGRDWSAVVDVAVALICIVVALSVFLNTRFGVWVTSILCLSIVALAGQFHHFKDSGESGPLPYEWINNYITQALPLIVLVIAFKTIWNRSTARSEDDPNAPLLEPRK